MGFWNGTCNLTNLPIRLDDPVYGMITLLNPYFDRSAQGLFSEYPFHSTDYFIPISAPIKGKYDGYGGIKDIENPSSLYYLHKIIVQLNDAGYVIQNDKLIPFPQDPTGVIATASQHHLRVKWNTPEYKGEFADAHFRRMSLSLMHHFAFECAITNCRKEDSYGRELTLSEESESDIENYVRAFMKDAFLLDVNKTRKACDNLLQIDLGATKKLNQSSDTPLWMNFYISAPSMTKNKYQGITWQLLTNQETRIGWSCNPNMFPYGLKLLDDVQQAINPELKKNTEKRIREFIKSLTQFPKILWAMEELHKLWMPQCGMGFQGQFTKVHENLLKKSQEFIINLQSNQLEMRED